MRTAFISSLIEHARTNPNIFLIVGDLGYSVVEPFAAEFPDRFLNAGVAEQNMTGVAAGLAAEGYQVFTYSIANFPTLRCLEQIRNDICYHNLPVTIVAVGAGLAYGNLGYSHHGVQDIATMRCMPNITIASPADPGETRGCLEWLVKHARPSYLRLGKAGEPQLHGMTMQGTDPIQIVEGESQLAICATGSILSAAIEAAAYLRHTGISPYVFSFPFLAPLKSSSLEAIWRCENVLTVEEHVLAGGLSSLLREASPDHVRFRTCHVSTELFAVVGAQDHLRATHRLTATDIARASGELLSH